MKKVFIDCGCNSGEALMAFLGEREGLAEPYYNVLKPRDDAFDYQLIAFEDPGYQHDDELNKCFGCRDFRLIKKLAWIHDGTVPFNSNGESFDSRIVDTNGMPSWHPDNQSFKIRETECIDLAEFIINEFCEDDHVALKLDVEGAEYDILLHLINRGVMPLLDELYVEFHSWGNTGLREQIENAIRSYPHIHYRNDWP